MAKHKKVVRDGKMEYPAKKSSQQPLKNPANRPAVWGMQWVVWQQVARWTVGIGSRRWSWLWRTPTQQLKARPSIGKKKSSALGAQTQRQKDMKKSSYSRKKKK